MSLRHALLGLLAEGPASGYDLMRTFDTSLANVWPATQSQVYTELNRLTEGKYLRVGSEGPRGRKEYSITEAGRAELRHWLADTEPRHTVRSETLLRVFFLGNVGAGQARDYLARAGERAAGQLERLRAVEKAVSWDDDNLSVYGRLVLEYGLRFAAMQRDWAEWALAELATRGRVAGGEPEAHQAAAHRAGAHREGRHRPVR